MSPFELCVLVLFTSCIMSKYNNINIHPNLSFNIRKFCSFVTPKS